MPAGQPDHRAPVGTFVVMTALALAAGWGHAAERIDAAGCLELLGSPFYGDREYASGLITRLSGKERLALVPELIRMAGEGSWTSQDAALRALATMGGAARSGAGELGEVLLTKTRSGREAAAMRVYATLKAVSPEILDGVGPALASILAGGDPRASVVACRLVSLLGPRAAAAVPALTDVLGRDDKTVKMLAVKALGDIGAAASNAIPALVASAGADDAALVIASLAGIKKIGLHGNASIKAVGNLVESENAAIREAAANALATAGSLVKDRVPSLIAMLSEADPDSRQSAVTALASIGAPAVGPLVEAMKAAESNPEGLRLKQDVLRTLRDMGPAGAAAIPALRPLLKIRGYHAGLALDAAATVWTLDPGCVREAIETAVALLGSRTVQIRDEACALLATLGPACESVDDRNRCIDSLIGALREKSPFSRLPVARALGEFGAEAKMAVPFLQDLGRNPDLAGKINEVLVKIDPSAKVSTRVMDKLDTDLEDLL